MGLQMMLQKEKNPLFFDFVDAYWALDNVSYSTDSITFSLMAYPTRDAKLAIHTALVNPSIGGFGSAEKAYIAPVLYIWTHSTDIADVFPNGIIPAGRDAQYTAIYNWIKEYTQLPFEDVFELMGDEN